MKWYYFWVELLFGTGILLWKEASILLLFVYLVIRLTIVYEYLRKLIRVYQIGNELKILAIIKKLKISKEEILKISEEELNKLTVEQRKQVEKDFSDINR